MDACGASVPEKEASLRDLVPHWAGIPAELFDSGSSDGRQWIDPNQLPLEVELESSGQEHSCSTHPRLRKSNAVVEDRADTEVDASYKSQSVSHVVDVDQDSSVYHSVDSDVELLKNNVDNPPEVPASLTGGSDGEPISVNNISLTPVEVQSSEQQGPSSDGNSNHPHLPTDEELLVGAVVGAGDCNRRENVSRVVECQIRSDGSLDLDDVEKENVCNAEATAGPDLETGPRNSQQLGMVAHDSECRICHVFAAEEIINLGCACKHDLGQAHKRCAYTWFAFRNNWECEICGEMARNVKPLNPSLMARARTKTVFTLNLHNCANCQRVCVRIALVCAVWVIAVVVILYKAVRSDSE